MSLNSNKDSVISKTKREEELENQLKKSRKIQRKTLQNLKKKVGKVRKTVQKIEDSFKMIEDLL